MDNARRDAGHDNAHPIRHSGRIPHRDGLHAMQHITYRLSDSLPLSSVKLLREGLRAQKDGEVSSLELNERMEALLDAGHGSCILRYSEIASMIVRNWQHFDDRRYRLLAYVVMPNHCHVLIETLGTESLSKIVQSWKSYTANRIRAWIRDHPSIPAAFGDHIWKLDYYDRYIRSVEHYLRVKRYIEHNPVKAGLVRAAEDWEWSSILEGRRDCT